MQQSKKRGRDDAVAKKKAKHEFSLSRNPPLGPDTNAKSLHPTKIMNDKHPSINQQVTEKVARGSNSIIVGRSKKGNREPENKATSLENAIETMVNNLFAPATTTPSSSTSSSSGASPFFPTSVGNPSSPTITESIQFICDQIEAERKHLAQAIDRRSNPIIVSAMESHLLELMSQRTRLYKKL